VHNFVEKWIYTAICSAETASLKNYTNIKVIIFHELIHKNKHFDCLRQRVRASRPAHVHNDQGAVKPKLHHREPRHDPVSTRVP
jgi:hypothetical protein